MKPLSPQTVEDKGLSHYVTSRLREAILSGHFEAGEKLDQDMIAEDLNVSRTPIREALKVLASEGYVEIRSYRGAFIPVISQNDIYNIYEIRWIIESEMTRQATPVIPDSVLDEMDHLFQMDHIFDTVRDRRHFEVDQIFHDTIASYCKNKLLKETLDKMNNRIVRVRSFALHQPGSHLDSSYTEHLAILESIRSRNADEAARAMEVHLKNSAVRIMKYISNESSKPSSSVTESPP